MTEKEKKQRRKDFHEQSLKESPESFNDPVIDLDGMEEDETNGAGIKLHGRDGVLVDCVLDAVAVQPNIREKLSYICETDNDLHVGWQILPYESELELWESIRLKRKFNSIEHGYGDEVFVLRNGKMCHG